MPPSFFVFSRVANQGRNKKIPPPFDAGSQVRPRRTDKECVLCIFHKGTAEATRLIVSFSEALQVRIIATMARKRLRQVKADLTVLSRPFLDESAPSILADGLLRASAFLQVC